MKEIMNLLDKLKHWIKLNIYNPFKPHIVHSRLLGCYCVRRYSWMMGWEFLDKTVGKTFWWTDETYVQKYCKFEVREYAKTRLLQHIEDEEKIKEGFVYVPFKD